MLKLVAILLEEIKLDRPRIVNSQIGGDVVLRDKIVNSFPSFESAINNIKPTFEYKSPNPSSSGGGRHRINRDAKGKKATGCR